MIQFPERLFAARKMRGWSLEELSHQMGKYKISVQALNKFENGDLPLSEEVLFHLCDALGVKHDFFYRTTKVEMEKVNFRKLQSFPAKLQDKIIYQTRDFVERYLELEDLLGISPNFNVRKYTGFKIKSAEDVEEAAAFIRKEWKLGNGPLYNVVEMLEDQHIKVFEMEEEDGFQGMSAILQKKIAVIVLNKNQQISNTRKRFTALHELGHLVMDIDHLSEKTQEEYCHRFAGAMLIPKEKLLEEIGSPKRTKILLSELGQLKKQYGISISALLFRLRDCGIISATFCYAMMNEMRRLGIFEREPEEYDYRGEEKSNRFLQLLLRGISMEVISTTKAASLNNQKLAEFRKLM
ncbi:MAG: helix-turn-helix domain-containing protein [Bacteroidota bacterium]